VPFPEPAVSASPFATDPTLDALVGAAVERADALIVAAESQRTPAERRARRRFARLMADPDALGVVVALCDEVVRFAPRDAAAALRRTVRAVTVQGFSRVDAVALRLAATSSRLTPHLVARLVGARVRALAGPMILDAAPAALSAHLARRRTQGLRSNVNVLGEAVLGEVEAARRLARVVEMARRPDVHLVSVKLSSIVSQVVTVDGAGTVARAAERLRVLYRVARENAVLVTLDMEEYRDLRLTLEAATTVLDEEEFAGLDAGIVLQAYLPDSHAELAGLLEWAHRRHARAGATLKVRLVKGANLAMESAEAELHGWTPAPYGSKAEVDASYLRLLDVALRPEWGAAVRVGVASHNLYDVAFALEVARARAVGERLDVEMLEGMADAEALALVAARERVVLYTPVTERDDFVSAVAYLARRLEENTSPENYLSHSFSLAGDAAAREAERARFVRSVRERHAVAVTSRRHGARPSPAAGFANSADGDPTDPLYRAPLGAALATVAASSPTLGEVTGDLVDGVDPNAGGRIWYRYGVADAASVDAALARAAAAAGEWEAFGAPRRARLLAAAADRLESDRAHLVAVMVRDGGKTVAEADPEVSEACDFLRYYGTRAAELDLAGSRPLGVVVVVPPWNFPLAIPVGGVAAALAVGNAVVLKPAPETVAVAAAALERLWAAGVPREVLQLVPTRDDEVGRRLVTHEGVGAVVLTGSIATAELFLGWRPDLRLLAETSGKNAIVVSARCDVDQAVRDLVTSAFGHAGQKCSAASLAIVDGGLVERGAFTRQLADAVGSLAVGPASDLSTAVGPLIRPPEAALTRALTTLDPGESWLVEPRPLDEAGFLWRPGVKMGVAPGSWSHVTEWFGPVLGVMAAPDLTSAVAWQNDTGYGLTAGLATLDEGEAEYWIEHVEAGNLYLNRPITGAVVRRQPFGGWKRSSLGPTAKAGGPHYVECLREWAPVREARSARESLERWWGEAGSRALDPSALAVERNLQRFRHPGAAVLVRVDDALTGEQRLLLRALEEVVGVVVELTCAHPLEGARVESVAELVARAPSLGRVRWLSAEPAPADALAERGVALDARPLAQRGDVEGPRWLLEQSVSLTAHRYGNRRAGPRPRVPGLAEGPRPLW
jgi:RHH-type proline utilization regulon transcriptional repressor/proline dehydrogenase/delta 1-pyrroline-5-carboxylate dehydrogenase